MTSSKNTKRALLASVLSVVLCCAMLIGSTFAWFTDSVTSGGNQIIAGNLKVDLIHVDDGEEVSIKETPTHKIFNYDKWEPGYTVMETLKVVNKGNLAFKFRLDAVAAGATAAPTGEKLADVIDVWVYEGEGIPTTKSFAEMTEDANWRKAGSLSTLMADPDGIARGVLLPENTTPTNGEPVKEVQMTVALHMQEDAGNAYQGLTLGDLNFTLMAAQYTYEEDSFGNTYDEDATYGTGATIIGLKGTYDSLTAAAKAWRESKGVVTSGSTFGMNSLGTVDSITWVVSGEVATGDGEGVIGNNGAGQSILGGGYFTPSVTVNNIIIKGVNDAKIAKTGDSYLVSAAGKNVVYENITFVDTVRIDSNPANLTFKNCKFEAGFRMPHSATNGNVTIENCTFTGNESSGYAIFAQGNMASFKINGNTVSNCQRGINVQAGNNAVVTISGNTIKNITGKTDGFTYGSAIQLTSAKTFTVTNNTVSDVAVNAFHIYKGCAADSIVINDNDITAAYLCWNEANYTNVTSSDNTTNITNPSKCVTKTAEIDSDFALN